MELSSVNLASKRKICNHKREGKNSDHNLPYGSRIQLRRGILFPADLLEGVDVARDRPSKKQADHLQSLGMIHTHLQSLGMNHTHLQ